MDMSLSKQVFAFFAMVICGAFCGVIFDVFRSLRRMHKTGSGVVAIQDIIFWLLELTVVYMVAFKLNYAHIRAYEGVALIIGSWLYFMTVSSYVLRLLCGVLKALIGAFRFASAPFLCFGGKAAKVCKKAFQTAESGGKKLFFKIKHNQKEKTSLQFDTNDI